MSAIPLLMQTHAIPSPRAPEMVIVAVIYFLVCGGIALWATRRTRTADDFFAGGRGVGLWTLAIAAMAATVSGFLFISAPGLLYVAGAGALFISLSASITTPLSAWALGIRMRLLREVRGVLTVPDAVGARYRCRTAQGLAAVSLLVAIVGYISLQVLALGYVIDAVFHTGLSAAIVIGTATILAYSAAGGILAGVYVDVFQGMVMGVASTLVFLAALKAGGGLERISETILAADPGFLGPWGKFPPLRALSLFFVFGLGTLGQPHVLQKYYMIKDPRRLRWYPLLMTGALLLTVLLFFGVGMTVKAQVLSGALPNIEPGQADDVTPLFLLNSTPALLAGIVFSGVAAAIMSTANSFLNIGAAAVTHDIPVALGRRVSNELRVGRWVTAGISVLACGIALTSHSASAFLGIFGWGLFASTLVPTLAIGLNWPGATRDGAVASMATGLGITLIFESLAWFKVYTFPAGVTASGLALVLSILVFIGVSWVTRAKAEKDLDPDIRLVMEV